MKIIRWKRLIITCLVCLLPIILGVALFDKLPQQIAIHFDIHNNPDNFASKEFTVFGIPVLMALLQVICCFIYGINAKKHGERPKLERVVTWIIPVMCIILQTVTLAYSLDFNIDIRRVAGFIVGTIFIVLGNVTPKLDYVKNHDVSTDKARKINRFIGYESVTMGVLFMASLLLPPITTIVCIFLLIPYAIIGAVYGIKVGRSKS